MRGDPHGRRQNRVMLLFDVVAVSRQVAATSARSAKVGLIADLLRTADRDEIDIVVSYLSGELRQRRTGIGWATLRDLPAPAQVAAVTIHDVDATFARVAEMSGAGAHGRRAGDVRALLERATRDEQHFIAALVGGELRQGALDGVMVEAIAKGAEVPISLVRQAFMLQGRLPPIAAVAFFDGAEALAAIGLEIGRPVQPMLAQPASSIADALAKAGGEAALEWKLDGIRVQIHRNGNDVAVFTRTLDDITERVPELVEVVRALDIRSGVFDGEAIALDAGGRPLPFQETAARTSSRLDVAALREQVPLRVFLFDVLAADDATLLDQPLEKRHETLVRLVPDPLRVPRIVTADPRVATDFFADAIAHGHEGVVVKSLAARYEAGRRGAGWIKVKPRHTLDLVVLAAEWGHGRRRGLLSNLHLGARDGNGGFVMLGKTFKGLTDEMLTWQTRRFLEIEDHRDSYTVHLRPEVVVEVAFDGVQTSPRYPGGVALRFARVLRYRPDKRAADADHIDDVLAIHAGRRPAAALASDPASD
jgi:DNA ligase-1